MVNKVQGLFRVETFQRDVVCSEQGKTITPLSAHSTILSYASELPCILLCTRRKSSVECTLFSLFPIKGT